MDALLHVRSKAYMIALALLGAADGVAVGNTDGSSVGTRVADGALDGDGVCAHIMQHLRQSTSTRASAQAKRPTPTSRNLGMAHGAAVLCASASVCAFHTLWACECRPSTAAHCA
jgi:hypothetical protein